MVFDKNLTKNKTLGIYRVAVNDNWEASFTYNDPTLEVCQGESKQFVSLLLLCISLTTVMVHFFCIGMCLIV